MIGKFKIDLVSDVACPWCIIGAKRLMLVVEEMELRDRILLEWHPFEINPDLSVEGEELVAHIARKYGTSWEEGCRSREAMVSFGAVLGFRFDFFDGMKAVNTQNAHILLEYAREQGRQTELKMRLFSALYSERKDVSDLQVLAQQVDEVGLNVAEAMAQVQNDVARQRVRFKEDFWLSQGVTSVPTIIFNQSRVLVGAQSVESYKHVLAELIKS
jgi:predicted DsbA family dithiol-disulfide isomerase